MNTKIVAAGLVLSALAGAAWADETSTNDAQAVPPAAAAPAGPTFSDVLTSSGLTAAGYVSASYYHSNGYSTDHQFDVRHDSVQLDQAAFTLAYQPKERFGALVNVGAGEDMKS